MQQIALGKTLDVEIVEQELAALWQGGPGATRSDELSAGEMSPDDETAVLRARAANLLVFITNEPALDEVEKMLEELTAVHPSRVRSEEHTSELQSHSDLVCRLLLEKQKR